MGASQAWRALPIGSRWPALAVQAGQGGQCEGLSFPGQTEGPVTDPRPGSVRPGPRWSPRGSHAHGLRPRSGACGHGPRSRAGSPSPEGAPCESPKPGGLYSLSI